MKFLGYSKALLTAVLFAVTATVFANNSLITSELIDGCTDPTAVNYDPTADNDDGSCLYEVTFNVDMNCETGFSNVNLTGPYLGWCANCVPMADGDGDGIWTVVAQLPAGSFEYKYNVDDFAGQEDLVDDMVGGATCAPITDFVNFANRQVTIVAGAVFDDTYGTCGVCDPSSIPGCTDPTAENYNSSATEDDGSCQYMVTFNVDMNCETGFSNVNLTGPLFGWCANCIPMTDGDGDGIYSTTITIPAGDFEYKYNIDDFAGQEDLIDDMVGGATCAPVTDFSTYANRQVNISGADTYDDTYGTCGTCSTGGVDGCTDPTAVNYDSAATNDDGSCLYEVTFNVDMNCETGFSNVNLTGPYLGWCANCVPMTDGDGDGIYSVVAQLPAGNFEYKYNIDDFAGQEDLVDDMVAGGTCAPITDFATFANREVVIAAGAVYDDTYGTCGTCSTGGTDGCTDPTAVNYDSGATNDDGSCLYEVTFNVDMNCETGFSNVNLTGPYLGWCANCVPMTDGDADGIYSATIQLPAGNFEYKYNIDDFAGQEDLVDDMVAGGTCAPITDFATYANREVVIVAGNVYDDTYGSCDPCEPSGEGCTDSLAANYNPGALTDDGSCVYDVEFNVDMNCVTGPYSGVGLTGPDLGWCAGCEPMTDGDGDGVYTTTLQLPLGDFEYKYAIPGPDDSDYCGTYVQHLGIAAETASAILLRIENVDATTMIVEIESADSDPVDLLLVLNGSGATISAEDFSVPGKISRTLTWGTPPTDVQLNVLWSKDSFGGNWQLGTSDIVVTFASSCTIDPSEGEDLLDDAMEGGACVGSTDMSTFANRLITVTPGLILDEAYGDCDGCVPTVPGCTYAQASNYDPNATQDDGSCVFDVCPGDSDGNNVVNILDLVAVSSNFGSTCE